VTSMSFWQRALLLFGAIVAVAACSTGPQITRTQAVAETADTPYRNILVIMLYSSFDVRRQFENEVVKQLSAAGINAVASTSLMDTRTPVKRATFLAMVEALDSDAVLVTQVASLDSNTTKKDVSPQATYNITPTAYYNVWGVELTEYVEPPKFGVEASLGLATQIYSVLAQEAVWAIESKSKIEQEMGRPGYYPFFVDEAKAIAKHLLRDGLIAR
jgi:hypothetical protein